MGDRSGIQWTNATWNPVTGCTKVSQGCKHCYAERLAPRVFAGQEVADGHWTHPPRPRESGPSARPFDLAWARAVLEQAQHTSAVCFVKQLGRRPVWRVGDARPGEQPAIPMVLRDSHGGDPEEWPADLRVREFPRELAHA